MPYKDPAKRAELRRRWHEAHPNWRQEWREKNPDYAAKYRARKNELSARRRSIARAGREAARAAIARADTLWNHDQDNETAAEKAALAARDRARDYHQERRCKALGVTKLTRDNILKSQGGKCAICGATPEGDKYGRRFHLDHDHATGVVRGVLDINCNHGLGKFGDDPDRLRAAADYLERFRIST